MLVLITIVTNGQGYWHIINFVFEVFTPRMFFV